MCCIFEKKYLRMKKITLLVFLSLGLFSYAQEYKTMIESGNFTVKEIQSKAEEHFKNSDKGKGTGWVQYKRWEYFALRKRDENGYVKSSKDLFEEWNNYSQIQNQRNSNSVSNFNDDWSEIGPTYWNQTSGWNPGVGRLSSFAVEKTNQNHIITGSVGGGIWKTIDGGANWQPLSDNHGNMYVYSLSIDPSNNSTYYWGSSGGRIYKSTNGGNVWLPIASAGTSNVLKVLVHPTNSNIVFAVVQNSGLYKSEDGGSSWTRKIQSQFYDVEFDPNDSSIVFASGSGVYRSTDGGDSFSTITGFTTGAKMIGVSAENSNKVYIVEAQGSMFGGFYSSTDNGVTFTKLDHGNINYFGYESDGLDTRGQAPRDMGIAVSPTDANEVHIVGINSWKSTDGGVTFSITSQWVPGNAANQNIGYCHADIDDIEFVGDNLYVVTDGGIFICEDSKVVNSNYYRDLTTGMGIRQFYLMGISQTDPVIISAGSQDNGTSIYRQDGNWYDWLGADGFESFVDVNNSNVVYGTIYNGTMYKSTNQGSSYSPLPRPEATGWVTPFEQDATGLLYFGGRQVYKSENNGSSWSSISQTFSTLTNQVKIAPSNNRIIYASVDNGSSLYRTTNGGDFNIPWKLLSGFSGFINNIAVHPTNPDKVAIAVTGAPEKVYVSSDRGETWTGLSDNLPNFTPYAIVWDNNGRDGLYLGMDYGVYYIDDQYTEWNLFNNKLPNVNVTELEINYADDHLYVSTYGRGIWKSPRSNGVLSVDNHILESLNVYPNPVKNLLNISWDKSDKVSVRLFNLRGQLLYFNKQTTLTTPLQIDTKQLSSGVYFLKVSSSQGNYTKKLIVN